MSWKKKGIFKEAATSMLTTAGKRVLQEKFFSAVYTRNIPEITRCLDKGVNANLINEELGVTPLHLLAERNDYILGFRLITSHEKVDINVKTFDGYTSLHIATMFNCTKFVHMLLQNGALLDIPDRYGKTALHWAVQQQNMEIVKKLLGKGATINVVDSFENTPLSLSILNVENLHIARALLQKDIDPAFENSRTLHVFFETILSCHTVQQMEFVDLLLHRGVDITLTDLKSGRNCLHFVAITGYTELAVFLVAQGARYMTDFCERTPLKVAMEHGNDKMIDYLRKWNKTPNMLPMLAMIFDWSKKAKARVNKKKAEEEMQA